MSGRLPDGVCVAGPGQVPTDVNPEEPEEADSLHRSPANGEGGVFYSLSLPVVRDQLLRFADVEMDGWTQANSSLLVIRPMMVVSSENVKMVLELWVAT